MKDIQNREDIEKAVTLFYKKAIPDDLIGHFFTTVVAISWEEHIPRIISFWESVLLGTGGYKGNPMVKHIALNHLSPLQPVHFDRWLMLWKTTIEEQFSGPKATEAVIKATSIANLMQFKIHNSGISGAAR